VCGCTQVVRPQYSSLFRSLRHDLQLTCLVLTAAIYSCSVALITWPTGGGGGAAGCRRATSRNSGNDERLAWTGRSFDDSDGRSSRTTVDVTASAQLAQKCRQISAAAGDAAVGTVTLTWCSLIAVVYLVYVVECWFSPYRRRFADDGDRRRVVDTPAAYRLVTSLRNSFPAVRWTAVSYHYIRSVNAATTSTALRPPRHHKSYRQRAGLTVTRTHTRDGHGLGPSMGWVGLNE